MCGHCSFRLGLSACEIKATEKVFCATVYNDVFSLFEWIKVPGKRTRGEQIRSKDVPLKKHSNTKFSPFSLTLENKMLYISKIHF